ncbi:MULTISPECIES: serine hydrolase [unclassified Arthrobacter]|uniref:serine hydrolase domain-containing protein n=1 Tax=unclassified Arthrobacter TaxID=235627 RepID=UPI00159D0C22|nr:MULTISPECIES: serine hydrolase domain-containing protein [unclassified Arthrobacter]MCQ9164879.1 beta-lactamase family protein [Arthrobacter sp. STN4]NVM98175.1 beta-lactamase family protein [Arthrobacter sp. SDTb3-6]
MPAPYERLTTEIRHLLGRAVADGVAPAAGCAVVIAGETLPAVTAGTAAPGTFFDLASVTKLFSTVTMLSLVDGGLLELDTPVGERLPAYAQGGKAGVTLRHLLTHTSGLPSEWRGWERTLARGRSFERILLIDDLLGTALEAAPGTRFAYSCAGFNTAMALAEHVTAMPWARLVEDRVLARLGTDGITGAPDPQRCAPTEYQPELGRGLVRGIVHDEAAWSLGGLSGNAGMFATAPALAVFGEALRTGLAGILSAGLADEMWRSQLPEVLGSHFNPADPGFGHGLGLRINQQPWMGSAGRDARGHGGFTGTSLLVDKENGITIALLSNRVSPRRDGDDATGLRQAVSDVVYSGRSDFN